MIKEANNEPYWYCEYIEIFLDYHDFESVDDMSLSWIISQMSKHSIP